jgi:hypothetical protein
VHDVVRDAHDEKRFAVFRERESAWLAAGLDRRNLGVGGGMDFNRSSRSLFTSRILTVSSLGLTTTTSLSAAEGSLVAGAG